MTDLISNYYSLIIKGTINGTLSCNWYLDPRTIDKVRSSQSYLIGNNNNFIELLRKLLLNGTSISQRENLTAITDRITLQNIMQIHMTSNQLCVLFRENPYESILAIYNIS